MTKNSEVPLESYRLLQELRDADEGLMRRILSGLSCRKYEGCAEAVPKAFGISSSTISWRFIKVSASELRELMERDLPGHDFEALFIDGKSFAQDEMIIALGVTMSGEKVVLGFIQAATEKEGVVKDFLQGLIERGLHIEQGLVCIIDGAKGICSAIQMVFGERALVKRCQWHKREYVVDYLPKHLQVTWRRKLQGAHGKPTYGQAADGIGRWPW